MTKSSKQALVVIDVQTGFIDGQMAVYQSNTMLARIKALIQKARSANVDVIYVRHDEEPEFDGDIHSDIAPHENEAVISKMTPDSFYQTNLHDVLQEKGVTQLVIVGFQTEMCIDTTTRRAKSQGYTVTLVSDAHSTVDFEGNVISAETMIAYHNSILDNFAYIKPMAEIVFD